MGFSSAASNTATWIRLTSSAGLELGLTGEVCSNRHRAVYLSETDSGASKEVTARKSRLGGIGQISIDKYPRVVYAVSVDLKKALDLSTLGSSQAAETVRTTCLDMNNLRPSMDLARELIIAGIEGLVFPSVVGGDDNLVVYRANCGRNALSLKNEREIIDQVRRIAGRHK